MVSIWLNNVCPVAFPKSAFEPAIEHLENAGTTQSDSTTEDIRLPLGAICDTGSVDNKPCCSFPGANQGID